jgi:hypothetical protein
MGYGRRPEKVHFTELLHTLCSAGYTIMLIHKPRMINVRSNKGSYMLKVITKRSDNVSPQYYSVI